MKKYTLMSYTGGKYGMLEVLYSMFPYEYITWIDVFCGSAVVTLNKKPSKVEVINDINNDIYNLFFVVKHKHREFLNKFKYVLNSRTMYYNLIKQDKSKLDDVDRAFRTYYIIRNTFGSRLIKPSFAIWNDGLQRGLYLDRLPNLIDVVYNRLQNVLLENLDYKDILIRYDSKDSFFFLDPPYLTKTGNKCGDYRNSMSKHDYVVLNTFIRKLKGKFLITTNDSSFLKKLFEGFYQKIYNIKYSISNREVAHNPKFTLQNSGQLIIANYDFENQSLYNQGFFKQGGVQCFS